MNTDKEFQIMQLSDSFFPSGMFSMSGGLESLFQHNIVTNGDQIREFIIELSRYYTNMHLMLVNGSRKSI